MSSPVVQKTDARVTSPRTFERTANGNLWFAHNNGAGEIEFFLSTDQGGTWSPITGFSGAYPSTSGAQGFRSLAFFIDIDDYAHIIYRKDSAGADVWTYRRGTPDTNRTSWTWSAQTDVQPATTQEDGSPAVVAHRQGTGWKAHVFYPGYDNVAGRQAHMWKIIDITSGGSITVPSGEGTRVNTANDGLGSDSLTCALDFRHNQTDRGVQSSTPSLYFAYGGNSMGNIYFKKALYSGGSWFLQTERTVDAEQVQPGCLDLYYDGTRVVIAWSGTTSLNVEITERDEADTTFTARNPATTSGTTVRGLSLAQGANDDIWIFCRESTNEDVERNRYNRGGATWDGWSNVDTDATATGAAMGGCVTALRSAYNNGNLEGLSVIYHIFDTAPDIIRWENVFGVQNAAATLQGVGTLTAVGTQIVSGDLTLQGVGTLAASAGMTFGGTVDLQGVGLVTPKGEIVPKQDYTVYDAYLQSAEFPDTLGLIYYEDEQTRPSEVSQQLRPPRQDVGNEATEIRPESGETFSQTDFSMGAGQLYFHHEGRDIRKYLWSEGFDSDIDTVGETALLEHLHATEFTNAGTFDWTNPDAGRVEVYGGALYVILGTTVARTTVLPGGFVGESPHVAETPTNVRDLASDGEYLYAALGANGIHRRNVLGTWAHWNDVQATRVAYIKSRIMATSDNSIYEVILSGPAPTVIETLPSGWKFTSMFESSGYIYATVVNESDGLSRVHTYGLNDSGTAIEKKNETPAPRNQLFRCGVGYLGLAFLGGGIRTSDGGYDPVLYEAIPDASSGALTYQKLAEGEGAGAIDLGIRAIIPSGENIIFAYSLGAGFAFGARDGLGMYKLKNGAFLPYLKTPSVSPAGRQIRGLIQYQGRICFVGETVGFYSEDPAHLVQQATLWSSIADWQTTADKIWDLFQVVHEPLPASSSVQLFYTTAVPSANQYTQVLSSSVQGSDGLTARAYDITSSILGIKIVSNANPAQTLAPTRQGFFVRSNVIPDQPEFVLNRYVRVLKRDRKDEGAEDVFIADVQARKRDFQRLAYKWITLYEPGVIWTVRVVQVANVTPFLPLFEQTIGEEKRSAFVIQLVMEGTRD